MGVNEMKNIITLEVENARLKDDLADSLKHEIDAERRLEMVDNELGQMYAKHPEPEGCYEALPRLRRELAEAQKDTERLDWYIKFIMKPLGDVGRCLVTRKTIDEAMTKVI